MRRIGMFCIVLAFFASFSRAQVTTATVAGTVSDKTGAVLPGAKIMILNEDTGISRSMQTDASGRYAAPSLSVGKYKVTASLEGFQSEARSGIELTVGRNAVVDFQLSVGAVTQTVEVTGEAPLVETTQSAVSALVNSTTINELPLNGRSLSDLVLMQPGVAKLENAATAVHRGFGTQINIVGARSDDNTFLLDGTDIADYQNNAPVGPNGIMYGAGAVREFQVQTNNYGAQYGRALGGIFNAVSQSGTNRLNGEIFDYLRNSDVDARNFFDIGGVPPFRRNQFGGSLGGPILKDKTFFYLNYEGLRSSKTNTRRPVVPGAALRSGILPNGTRVPVSPAAAAIIPTWPLPSPGGRAFSDGTAEFITEIPLTVQSDFGQARIDHQVSEKDSLFGRFTILNQEQTQAGNFPGFFSITPNGSRFTTLSETHIFSPRDLNTVRFAFNRTTLLDNQNSPKNPGLQFFPDSQWAGNLSIQGVTGFSIGLWPFFRAITNRFEVIDDVTLTRGNHSLQVGANFQRVQGQHLFPNNPNGAYTFTSFTNFLQNQGASLFRGTPLSLGDFYRGMRQWFLSSYLQDDWRVRPSLTLNLGVRFDFDSVPTEVNGKISSFRTTAPGDFAATGQFVIGKSLWQNPTPTFGPRVGFAWSPFQKHTATVRGGFGMFYGRLDFRDYWANRDGFIAKGFAVSNPTHFPDGIAELAAQLTTQVFTTSYSGLRTPHTLQWTLNVEQQIGSSTVVSVGYVGTRGVDLISISNPNAPESQFVNGVLTIPSTARRRNPSLETIDLTSTGGDSWYQGLTVGLRRRLSAGLQYQVAYTFSKALCTAEQTSRAQLTFNQTSGYFLDPAHIDADKGYCSWDTRNMFIFNYVYELPFGSGKRWMSQGIMSRVIGGWELGGVFALRSGNPYTYEVTVPQPLSALTVQVVRPNAKAGVPVGGTILGRPNESCGSSPCLRYYDPNSFAPPGPFQLGNIGRNTGVAPGAANWDASLQKRFLLTERFKLQFRAEAFNLLNRANFGLPGRTVFNPAGQVLGNAGVISTTQTDSRQFQFGLRLFF